MPYFAQGPIVNPVAIENEYARIMLGTRHIRIGSFGSVYPLAVQPPKPGSKRPLVPWQATRLGFLRSLICRCINRDWSADLDSAEQSLFSAGWLGWSTAAANAPVAHCCFTCSSRIANSNSSIRPIGQFDKRQQANRKSEDDVCQGR